MLLRAEKVTPRLAARDRRVLSSKQYCSEYRTVLALTTEAVGVAVQGKIRLIVKKCMRCTMT